MEKNIRKATDKVIGTILYADDPKNISRSERIMSAAFGTFMFWRGAKDVFSDPTNAVWELIIGGTLLYRGATGFCPLKDKLESCGCVLEEKKKEGTAYVIESM